MGRGRRIVLTVLERRNVALSYDISFLLVGSGTRKLLEVELNNFGYFWVLIAQVTFSYLLLNQVTLGLISSYVLDFLLSVSGIKLIFNLSLVTG